MTPLRNGPLSSSPPQAGESAGCTGALQNPPPLAGEGREGAKPRFKTSMMMRDRARRLRSGQTPPEAVLWSKLRRNQLAGHHFRRQAPVGRYVVDFLCKQAKLVIELDGESHVGTSAQSSDRQRDLDLAALGYRILRVSNRELQNNLDGVLQTILERVEG